MINKKKIGVLISGSGTNLQEIISACADGRISGEVTVVISNKKDAYGLERAKKANISAVFINPDKYEDFSAYNKAILETLKRHEVELVAMAGYMKMLGPEVLNAYPNAVLNIHPALLPSFPGAHGIRDAFDYGVKVTGVTVHIANEQFDEGAIILQKSVLVEETDDLDSLEAKIHQVEYEIYPKAIQVVIDNRYKLVGHRVVISD